MAINPRASRQGSVSKEEQQAKQLDLLEKSGLSPADTSGVGELDTNLLADVFGEQLSGQAEGTADVPLSQEEEAQLGTVVEDKDEGLDLDLKQTTPTVIPESVTQPSPEVPNQRGLEGTQLEDYQENLVPTALDVAREASGRGYIDYDGNLLNTLSEYIPANTAERYEGFEDNASNYDFVGFSVKDAKDLADYDPESNEFDVEAEKIRSKQQAASEKRANVLKARTDGSPLTLTKGDILTSNKLLGIATKNENFKPSDVKLTEKGTIENFSELPNTIPYKVDPIYVPYLSMFVEDFLMEKAVQSDRREADPEESFDPERQEFNEATLGKQVFRGIRRLKSQAIGEDTDSYLEDYGKTDPKTFEAIGKLALDFYEKASGGYVERTVDPETGVAGYDLTPTGRERLMQESLEFTLPDFKKAYLLTKPELNEEAIGEKLLQRRRSGKGLGVSPVTERASLNASQVAMTFNSRRTALFIGLMESAVATDPLSGRGQFGYQHNLMDWGKSRMEKTFQIAKRKEGEIFILNGKIEALRQDMEELQSSGALDNNAYSYMERTKARLEFKLENAKRVMEAYKKDTVNNKMGPMVKPSLYSFANKGLEVANVFSRVGDRPFYQEYSTQTGVQRINTVQNNSHQTNLHMRQIIGSGDRVAIKPRSNTPEERMLMRVFASAFFSDGVELTGPKGVALARENIVKQTPRYKKYVALGNKVKDLLADYDYKKSAEGFKGLQVTRQGINGIERINSTSFIDRVNADPDLKDLFERLGAQKDPHKHAITQLDYMMALADYDSAMKNNTTMHTQVTLEMDGISNGLMGLQAMLGNERAMYRGGVLRAEVNETVLSTLKDIPYMDAYYGDLRETLSQQLQAVLQGKFPGLVLSDKVLQKELGYSTEEIDSIKSMLERALSKDNKANFRKSPLMTFPYGQEFNNLIGSVYKTLAEDEVLRSMAEDFGFDRSANILSEIRNKAIIETLGSDLVHFSAMVKDAVRASNVFGKPVEAKTNIDATISFSGYTNVYSGKTTEMALAQETFVREKEGVTYEKTQRQFFEAAIKREKAKGANADQSVIDNLTQRMKGLPSQSRAVIREKTRVRTPLTRTEGSVGSSSVTAALPTAAITQDATVVAQMFTGMNWDGITRAAGGSPFVLPIYDAFVVDLKSATKVEELVNKQWFANTTDGRLLNNISNSFINNMKEGEQEFKTLAESKKGGEPIDEQLHGDVFDYVIRQLELSKEMEPEDKKSLNLNSLKTSRTQDVNPLRTYRTLFNLQKRLIALEYNYVLKNFAPFMKMANENAKRLASKVNSKGGTINQYAIDNIFIGNLFE